MVQTLLITAILFLIVWKLLQLHLQKTLTAVHVPAACSTRYRLLNWIGDRAVSLIVGPIELSGLSVNDLPKPALVIANHPHFMDPFVIARLLKTRPKYMVHPGVYRSAGGLGAFCLSSASIVASKDAIEAAISILERQEHFVIFPEGYTNMDSKLLPFRIGAVRIARMANRQNGPSIPILPLSLSYNRYPGKWILRFQPPLQYLILLAIFWCYRGGVQVTIGDPIKPEQLPVDLRKASDFLRTQIASLRPNERPTLPEYTTG